MKADKVAAITLQRLPLDVLKPHERNPRIHPKKGSPEWKLLCDSLKHDYFDPLVWNKRNGKLVSGHLRRKVLLDMGYTHADVSVVDYDERTHLARLVAANKLLGENDVNLLKDMLLELDAGDVNMNLTGYSEVQLEDLMTATGPEPETELDSTVDYSTAYCAFPNGQDIGGGRCLFGCLYCFAQITPAGLKKHGKARPLKKQEVIKALEKAKAETNVFEIGHLIEPMLPELQEVTEFLFAKAKEMGVCLRVQTKNPMGILHIGRRTKFPFDRITARVAFSMFTEEKARILEPHAPGIVARRDAMNELFAEGAEVVLRNAPLFVGFYDGLEEFLDSLKGPHTYVCEPVRLAATGIHYWKGIEAAMDGLTVKDYFAKWGDLTKQYEGALHWYKYDHFKLRQEYKRIKEMLHRHNFTFGICSGDFGWKNCDLNDCEWCCKTKRKERAYTVDSEALTIRMHHRNFIKVDCLRRHSLSDPRTERAIDRLLYMNDMDDVPYILREGGEDK